VYTTIDSFLNIDILNRLSIDFKTIIKPEMFYWSFTSFVHLSPPLIFNPGYAYAGTPIENGRTGRKCRKYASGTCNGQN